MADYVGYFDGSCEPHNPGGQMGWGFSVCRCYKRETIIGRACGTVPAAADNSCNWAEYIALHRLLDWFLQRQLQEASILIRGDSQLVIKQCFGHWQIKRGAYVAEAQQVRNKLLQFPFLNGKWVPRQRNTIADRLSRRGASHADT